MGTRQKEAPHKKDNDNEVCLTNVVCEGERGCHSNEHREHFIFATREKHPQIAFAMGAEETQDTHGCYFPSTARLLFFLPSETAIVLKPGAASTPTTSGTKLSITEFWIIK